MKEKDSHFKLSSSFKTLFTTKNTSSNPTTQQKPTTSTSADKGLFKLNPRIANHLDDVPVDVLRKKSRTKLESLKDEAQSKKFSIFNEKGDHNPNKESLVSDKKNQPKKYNLEMGARKKSKQKGNEGEGNPQIQQLPSDIVKPSSLQQTQQEIEPGVATLFQTPILPCFASEFNRNAHQSQFKEIKEKEGVWKIGKIKIKGKQAKLVINGFEFEASLAQIQGKAAAINEANYFELPNWEGVWVVQPHQSLFE